VNRDQIVAGGVAGAAFVCSATHIYQVAVETGNHWAVAAVHPLGLDGLIYIGMRAVSGGRRWQGWLATVYGVGMSLTFNAVSYAGVDMPAPLMAVAMPIALVLGVLVVGHKVSTPDVLPVDTAQDMSTPAVSTPRSRRVRPAPADVHPLIEVADAAVSAVRDMSTTAPAPAPARVGPAVEQSEDDRKEKARRMRAEGRSLTEVAAALGVSTKTVQRWTKSE